MGARGRGRQGRGQAMTVHRGCRSGDKGQGQRGWPAAPRLRAHARAARGCGGPRRHLQDAATPRRHGAAFTGWRPEVQGGGLPLASGCGSPRQSGGAVAPGQIGSNSSRAAARGARGAWRSVRSAGVGPARRKARGNLDATTAGAPRKGATGWRVVERGTHHARRGAAVTGGRRARGVAPAASASASSRRGPGATRGPGRGHGARLLWEGGAWALGPRARASVVRA